MIDQSKQDVINAILLSKITNKRKITSDLHLIEDLCLDSMDVMEVVAMIEDELDIVIPINHLYDVRLVKDLHQCIENLMLVVEA